MSFESCGWLWTDFQFCRRGLYKDATSSSRFCITLVYSCTVLGFQCEGLVKLLNEKRSLLRRMIRRRGRTMRGLWSILVQSFSQVSKSGSIFSQFGSGFTEKD